MQHPVSSALFLILLIVAPHAGKCASLENLVLEAGKLRTEGYLGVHINNTVVNSSASVKNLVLGEIEYELDFHRNPQEPKNKIILAIIVGMQFGMCGVDRCFLGQVLCGVGKGLTCGGFFIWHYIDMFVLIYNILIQANSINMFYFNAVFEPKTVTTALYVWLVIFVLSCLMQARAKPDAPKSEARAMVRRNTAERFVGPPDAAEVRAIFARFDKDKSGGIDKEELGPALNYLGIPQEQHEKLRTLMDADGDGNINIEEFAAAFEKGLIQVPEEDP